ncbi:TFIIF-interacting CTD phosphatase [Ordospora colligata]|uniref:RNA polymerase II subunit A C-terminal domain phosphatase n=1 Tax=Ordospora colligata OC4 TaxID=1354746 RepID=A0A0B2UE50_9MICR|nr:TFIIF-interacting CTD phosphatase [Ordospora colligata OC4]KHN69351.1 TFIIF-interacting CTD phosphatase [Ordospora colligata OC4]TBU14865.1 TFIIF-interacting CTD phosphatase [Ordospora colligata]TBU14996.1 TFIIF-interacting CTD phosphatase [Ordospora colligata]TBU18250.1 TFIIF-interacting CTD phosphatase [Ordospora colligata]
MVVCNHSVRLGNLCGVCGAEISEEESLFCALYTTCDVQITHKHAVSAYRARMKELKRTRKLILVLDLDQTILHTVIHDACSAPPQSGLESFVMDRCTYFVKLRPNLQDMLEEISTIYEIHVYTMGTRAYAQRIVAIIDPKGLYFHDRIITRDENQGMLVKSLGRMFPSKHKNIVILDDRADVWDFCENLLLVRPFWYFNCVDINDPLRLRKKIQRETGLDVIECKRKRVDKIADNQVIEKLEEIALGITTSSALQTGEDKQDIAPEPSGYKRNENSRSLDDELLKITQILKRIHKRYFSSMRGNVKKILRKYRKKVFDGKRIFVAETTNKQWLTKMIEMHGGIVGVSGNGLDCIVSQSRDDVEDLAKRFECLVIQPGWIAECVYSLKGVNYGKYIMCDYRVMDECENEIERMFMTSKGGPVN